MMIYRKDCRVLKRVNCPQKHATETHFEHFLDTTKPIALIGLRLGPVKRAAVEEPNRRV
jgi:hypothetical protein